MQRLHSAGIKNDSSRPLSFIIPKKRPTYSGVVMIGGRYLNTGLFRPGRLRCCKTVKIVQVHIFNTGVDGVVNGCVSVRYRLYIKQGNHRLGLTQWLALLY